MFSERASVVSKVTANVGFNGNGRTDRASLQPLHVSLTEEIPDSSVQNKNSPRSREIKLPKTEMKLRKKGMKVRKKGMKVRKSFFVPRWRFRNSYRGNGDLRLLQKSTVSFRVDIRAWRVADMTHQGGLDSVV